GLHDPLNVTPAMGRCEVPEVLPGLRVGHQGLFDEGRNVQVALALFRLCFFAEHCEVDLHEPGLGHSAVADQFAQPSFVQRRPLGPVATRGKLLRELLVVDPLDDAIDPAEAQGLLDRMVVRNARLTGMFLVVDEPNLGLRLVVLREPGAPFLRAGYVQRLAYFHFVLAATVADNDRRRTTSSPAETALQDCTPRKPGWRPRSG